MSEQLAVITSRELTTPLPADAEIFRFSQGLAWVALVGTIFLVGVFVLTAIVGITEHNNRLLFVAIALLPFYGAIGFFGFRSFHRLRDSVAVSPKGVWYLPKKGTATYIAWQDVATVKADDVGQRLVLLDASGTQKIRLEYQLGNFAQLRDYVTSHADAAIHRVPAGNVFHRTWINKGVFCALAGPFIFFAWKSHAEGDPLKSVLPFVGIAAFFLIGILRDPTTIEITSEGFEIKYPAWKQTIPFGTISAISLKDVNDRRGDGNVWAAVIIERKHARSIKLYRFREGSIALHEALESAWRSSGAARPAR